MLVEYLKHIPLFSHLKDAQLREVAARCKTVKYKKGDVVFSRTDTGTDLYIVNAGTVKAILMDDEGDEIVLAFFEKGAYFGELNLIDGRGRSATIVADKDAELAVLNKDVFVDLITKDPKIAIALMTTLVERLRKADDMIESLAFQEVAERLIRLLMENASTDKKIEPGYLKTAKLTHKDLAARIGSSREAVSKCMKVMSGKAIIKDGDGCFLIADNALDRLKSRPLE